MRRHKKSGKKERYDEVVRLYNSFAVKDMTLDEFRKAYERETSPVRLRNELKELVRFRGHQRTRRLLAEHQKQTIDKKVLEN